MPQHFNVAETNLYLIVKTDLGYYIFITIGFDHAEVKQK